MKREVSIKAVGVFCLALILLAGCASAEKPAEKSYSGTKSVSEYADILEKNPNGVFANRDGEKLRTQIISFLFVEGNRVYFGTGSEKPFYGQLLAFPYVSYCTYPEDFEPVLSLNGKAVFSDDKALKERALNGTGYASGFLRNHYKTADNPNLKLFYIDVEEIETYDSDGAKNYKIK